MKIIQRGTNTPAIAPLSAESMNRILDKMEVIAQVVESERLPNTAKALSALIAQARLAAQPVPECAMCNDSGIVGFPPDQYEDCPDCVKARAALAEPVAAQADTTEPPAGYLMPDGVKNQIETLEWKVRNLERALEMRKLHEKADVWYWQGDGADRLDTMSMGMIVVIRADQLRDLLATSAGEADTTASVSGESVSKAELWDAIHQYVSDYGDQFRMPPTTGAGKRCNASRDELAVAIDRLYTAPVATAAPADPLREAVKTITQFVNDGEWADLLHTDPDVVALWDAVDRLLAKNGAAPVSQAVEQPADDAEDAARYRAWRGAMVTEDEDFYIEVMARLPASKEPPKPEAVDAAIDAAMSAAKQEGA